MNLYIDASILVSFFAVDDLTEQADRFFAATSGALSVSDFACTEFASAIARRVRTRDLTRSEALGVFSDFDAWKSRAALHVATTSNDIDAAGAHLRRLDLGLRTGDAIHIAIALRIRATLATLDKDMARSAARLGLSVAE